MSARSRSRINPLRGRKSFSVFWAMAVFFTLVFCLLSKKAEALPWDIDMYKQESYKANEIARAPAKGTVPLGFTPFNMSNDKAGEVLKNTQVFGTNSVWRGQRLYNANCWACHGKTGVGDGPVGLEGSLGVPNLLTDFYSNSPEGKVFGVIYNGGSNMPRYGYKFSHTDIWDIVNYLKFLQGKDVGGIKRPVGSKKAAKAAK